MATSISSTPVSVQYGAPSQVRNDAAITVLLTTFAGLGLPRTLSLPVKASTTIHDVLELIYSRLPRVEHALIITTTSNKQLLLSDNAPISTLLSNTNDSFIPLRLSARLCGGKGGFGSQLRAAGGRMSSKKNGQQKQNGSNRNLDGRRLRTVDEAKKLAEYLATKPGMEEKEKIEKRKRWEEVIAAAERTEEAIKSGNVGSGGRLDAEYVESKELAEEKTKQAVLKAMKEGMLGMERTGSESSMEVEKEEGASDDEAEESTSGSSEEATTEARDASAPYYFGWDDEDEDSEDDEAGDAAVNATQPVYQGKGKAKAD